MNLHYVKAGSSGNVWKKPKKNICAFQSAFFHLSFFVSLGCFSSKGEDRLFRRLFRRYNQFIRPVENVSDPVTVEFEVSISQLVKVVRVKNEPVIVSKQRNHEKHIAFLFSCWLNRPFCRSRMRWIRLWKPIYGWDMWVVFILFVLSLVMLHYLYWVHYFVCLLGVERLQTEMGPSWVWWDRIHTGSIE